MPALILFCTLVSSFVFYLFLRFTLSQCLIYPHLLISPPLPCCFLLSLLPSQLYFPAAPSALPCRMLRYTNVSLTLLSVCLCFFYFLSAASPCTLFKVLSLWLVRCSLSVDSFVLHLSCSLCCNAVW